MISTCHKHRKSCIFIYKTKHFPHLFGIFFAWLLTKCIYKITSVHHLLCFTVKKVLNSPFVHALIVCMFQFGNNYSHCNYFRWKRMFTFWLWNKKICLREKHSRVQTTIFYGCHSYSGDALSWWASKIRMNREKNGGHFILFHFKNRPRDQIL
jgi:hypothetical protein